MSIAIKIVNWFALVFAGAIVLASLAFAYVLMVPLDVVRDWQVTVDERVYHPKEEVVLHASYNKIRDVTGTAYYYLECHTKTGSLTRYPIVQTEGNRPKGKGQADVPLKLPSEIPNLPSKCRIAVSVDYTIYTFRKFVENNESNEFEVKE